MSTGSLDIHLATGWSLRVEPIAGGRAVRSELRQVRATALSRDSAEAVEGAASFLRATGHPEDAVALERAFRDGTTTGGGR